MSKCRAIPKPRLALRVDPPRALCFDKDKGDFLVHDHLHPFPSIQYNCSDMIAPSQMSFRIGAYTGRDDSQI